MMRSGDDRRADILRSRHRFVPKRGDQADRRVPRAESIEDPILKIAQCLARFAERFTRFDD